MGDAHTRAKADFIRLDKEYEVMPSRPTFVGGRLFIGLVIFHEVPESNLADCNIGIDMTAEGFGYCFAGVANDEL